MSARIAYYLLSSRDIVDDVKSAPDTFSSWDKCMQKSYCKWPVIAAIVIGSIILLSFLFCVARCICCGVELCSCCVSCFSCCGSCCKGGGGRDRRSRYKDDYTRMPPTPYQGYQPQPSPMAYGANGNYNGNHNENRNVPQFATFDDPSSKPMMNEDSLPPMPSWDTATKRRVEDTSLPQETKGGDLEMGRLDSQQHRMRGGYNSVPNTSLSPNPSSQQDYFHNDMPPNHGYNSDLGDQRLMGNHEQQNFQAVPLSPPPTYRSASNAPSMAGDHFAAGATSPSPHDYNRALQNQSPPQQPQYHDSYAPSNMSTRYAPSHDDYSDSNRISMPMPFNPGQTAQSHSTYPEPAPAPYDARPPSFLQVGRKPVTGSYREV